MTKKPTLRQELETTLDEAVSFYPIYLLDRIQTLFDKHLAASRTIDMGVTQKSAYSAQGVLGAASVNQTTQGA